MKKILYISLLLINSTAFAQADSTELTTSRSVYFRAGGTILVSWEKGSEAFVLPMITLAPGLRLLQAKGFAATITLPVSIGPSFKGWKHCYPAVDIPAMLEFHLGSAAANSRQTHLGFMIGGGIAFHAAGKYATDQNKSIDITQKEQVLNFWGYRFHTGFSFGSKRDDGKVTDRAMVSAIIGKSGTKNKFVTGLSVTLIMGAR